MAEDAGIHADILSDMFWVLADDSRSHVLPNSDEHTLLLRGDEHILFPKRARRASCHAENLSGRGCSHGL
jgi:hypothetical protein